MKTGVQSLGWYVLRAPDPVPLIRFYRDNLGLSELRGRETPPDQASAMLWAGGTTVFEPNRLRVSLPQAQTPASLTHCPFVPVFRSRDLSATQDRLGFEPEVTVDATYYYRDPLGFFFGLDQTDEDTGGASDPDVAPLADDLVDLCRLEYRVSEPDTVAAFYANSLGLKRTDGTGDVICLDMGDSARLTIQNGGEDRKAKINDREEAVMVPVFRLYGYDHFKTRMDEQNAPCLQEVELTGGLLWYGWDPAGHLFGFQERKPPDPDPDKWTTRLPEDLMARRLWEGN